MGNAVSIRGQTVIPKDIRERFHIDETTKIEWIISNDGIRVIPISENLIKDTYGMLKGTQASTASLLKARKENQLLEKKRLGRLRGK